MRRRKSLKRKIQCYFVEKSELKLCTKSHNHPLDRKIVEQEVTSKGLAQLFTTSDLKPTQPKMQKKHSSDFDNDCWDKAEIENTLCNWYVPKKGKIVQQRILIKVHKIPLREIHERLLRKQHKYMRLTPTAVMNNMTDAQLLDKLKTIGYLW